MTRHDLTGSPLDLSLAHLPLSQSARDACSALDAHTIREFLAIPADRVRSPGRRKALAEVRTAIDRHLSAPRPSPGNKPDQRRLLPLVKSRSAAAALLQLGITTIEQFLTTPYSSVRGTQGLGPRTWQRITATILAQSPERAIVGDLLPDSMRALDLRSLGLSQATLARLEHLGCRSFAQLLGLPSALWQRGATLGPSAAKEVRGALDRQLTQSLPLPTAGTCSPDLDWPLLTGRLLAALDAEDRELLCARTGLRAPLRTARELAHASGRTLEAIQAHEALVVSRLHERAPKLMQRLASEGSAALDQQKGVLTGRRLPSGTALQVLAEGSGDRELPARLLAFCFPDQFHNHGGGCLSSLPPAARLHFERELRALTAPRLLPRPLAEIEQGLAGLVDPVPRGLLLHLLADRFRLCIHHDARRGDLVLPQHTGPRARLAELLEEHGSPMTIVDLLFAYRERFHAASRQRIQEALRSDAMFVEIGPDVYSLRRWHSEELALAQGRAQELVATICERGGRHAVRDLLLGADARTHHLVLDQVQRSPRIRRLGRGEVCPAGQTSSQAMERLLQAFRRAQGEVVLSRFLDNQPQSQRRLMERLLRENRCFVFPATDRIDVLANYPFNPERMQRLLALVDGCLQSQGGHAPLATVLEAVNQTELGGKWLDATLLAEVLRRHGNFELLPGAILASRDLQLGGWVLRRARAALRAAAIPITVQEILAERPELASFRDCLQELLQQDPLVQSPDGMHFMIA